MIMTGVIWNPHWDKNGAYYIINEPSGQVGTFVDIRQSSRMSTIAGSLTEMNRRQFQRLADGLIHVVIPVFAKPSADDKPINLCRLRTVFLKQGLRLVIVHRVIRFITRLPCTGIFAHDNGLAKQLNYLMINLLKIHNSLRFNWV